MEDLVSALHDSSIPGEELVKRAQDSNSKDFSPPAKLFELALQREVPGRSLVGFCFVSFSPAVILEAHPCSDFQPWFS